jgi:hypothetical protein
MEKLMGRKREPTGPLLTREEKELKYLKEIADGVWGYEELIVRLAREEVERRSFKQGKDRCS